MGAICCAQKVDYQGSVFYRKIDAIMEKTGKQELDDVFAKADDPLEQAEKTRQKIADAFKVMTTVTGTCVLKIPDLEQCIRAYIIRFFVELRKNVPTSGGSIEDDLANLTSKFNINELFKFSQASPYLSLDEEKLKKLQESFKFNPNEGDLAKMKDAIINFLKTLEGMKKVFDEYAKEVGEIKEEAMEFVSKLKISDGMTEIMNQIGVGKRNLQKILDMRDILQVFGEVGNQLAETVEVCSKWYKDPNCFKKFDEMAQNLVNKKISDMKKLVWETTNEQKLPKFEDWENNFEYRVVGEVNN